MPVMDGITFIRKLKSQIETRFIPIIMLTAMDDVDSEVEVIDAGADDYLTKPANSKRLLARIKRLLTKYDNDKKESEQELLSVLKGQ
jgi:DNA-binding response OmpR family regulator